MDSLVGLERYSAQLLVRRNVDILAELAEHDAQARRALKTVSLLLKTVTEEARVRAAEGGGSKTSRN